MHPGRRRRQKWCRRCRSRAIDGGLWCRQPTRRPPTDGGRQTSQGPSVPPGHKTSPGPPVPPGHNRSPASADGGRETSPGPPVPPGYNRSPASADGGRQTSPGPPVPSGHNRSPPSADSGRSAAARRPEIVTRDPGRYCSRRSEVTRWEPRRKALYYLFMYLFIAHNQVVPLYKGYSTTIVITGSNIKNMMKHMIK